MNSRGKSVLATVVAGLAVLAPIYLVILLMLKTIRSLSTILGPLGQLLPHWLPGSHILSFLLVLVVCYLTGFGMRSLVGHHQRFSENSLSGQYFRESGGHKIYRFNIHAEASRLTGKHEAI